MARKAKPRGGMEALNARHPYIAAHTRYVNGELTELQAAAMAAQDREFIAECELRVDAPYRRPIEWARDIVRGPWSRELVANIRNTKQGATS